LATADYVLSVAQLGSRLHALVDLAIEDPAASVMNLVRGADAAASVEQVRATLEDVFVASTRPGRAAERRGSGDPLHGEAQQQ
jgi:ABC-2 type transport system ATP-binding protein